ncbi:MAG: phenylalanyl-tRNA synthetase subunit beta [Desulfobulbaceae bacterium BRH_c16a]|nr:MAG: phenylalanyl-tRNA synthetase subunit beta [Desulfobulbaceae bacterium BRH_c16a]
MKLTLDWLQNYVDIAGLSPDGLAGHLTMLGLEVDAVTPLYRELAPLKTGMVVAAERHPDADKLTVCQVQIGDTTHQIVCGAPNVRKGLAVVVALPGTVLPGDFKIGKSKIRGVESFGMICSERELGLSNAHDGIMELPEGVQHGRSFIEAMGLNDTFVEVDLTPNRPDCASVIGVAREVAGVLKKNISLPVNDAVIQKTSSEFSVEVESSELCPRYAGRLIKNVKIGPSPWWLRKRLLSVGMRPISNIVDITNFVMLEYGQPLHAFDFDTLAGKKIVVRAPRADEMAFTSLDGSKRQLDAEMMMICDGEKPIAIAGIMGGENSEVSDGTTSILLESACFNPISIRRTARKLGLATEASYRFERGVDPNGTINALKRAVDLICELAGGDAAEEGVDCYGGKIEPLALTLRVGRTKSLLGIDLKVEEIAALLQSIGIGCERKDEDTLLVSPPSFRVDIEREADLIEEVARLYGYNRIPTSLPKVDLSYPEQDKLRLRRLAIADRLTSIGFTEAINYSFVSEKHPEMMALAEEDDRHQAVRLLNPLSEEQSVLRTMLLPGLLDNVRRNINFQKTDVKLFEIGKVFKPQGENSQPLEMTRFTGVMSGTRHGESSPLYFKPEPVDLFDAKGAVEFIFRELSLGTLDNKDGLHFAVPEAKSEEPYTEKGYALDIFIGAQKLGSLGKMRPDILRRFAIKHDVFFFDLDYEGICAPKTIEKRFTSLPVFPAVKRDIALVVPTSVSAGELLTAVRNASEKLIENCEIFDVFQGEKIPGGHKSVALSITYRSQTKTLTEKNVEKSHEKIVRLLTEQFGGSFRNA